MIAGGGHLSLPSRSHHVASAVLIGAKERAAAVDALFLAWLCRIERRGWPLRVARNVPFRCELLVVIGAVPIAAPFPRVSRNVIKTVAVRRKLGDRGKSDKTIFS